MSVGAEHLGRSGLISRQISVHERDSCGITRVKRSDAVIPSRFFHYRYCLVSPVVVAQDSFPYTFSCHIGLDETLPSTTRTTTSFTAIFPLYRVIY